MNKLQQIVYAVLYSLFPSIRKERKSLVKFDKIEELGRNEKCFCDNVTKYKKCHFIENENNNQVAIKLLLKGKMVGIKVLSKNEFYDQKGIKRSEIKVKNTFTNIEVGLGSHMD